MGLGFAEAGGVGFAVEVGSGDLAPTVLGGLLRLREDGKKGWERWKPSCRGELLLHTPNHAFITFSYPKLLNHTPSPKKGV